MFPLDDRERRRLLTSSAILCAIPLCLAPLAGRSSFELASERAAFDARFNAPSLATVWHDKPLVVARDPFVAEHTGGPSESGRTNSIVGLHVTQGQPIGFALPPNSGASGTPVQASGAELPTVTAIVSGPSPRALIDDGIHVRVIGIGDPLAGSTVASIDGSGVHLQNGVLIALAEDGQ